MLIRGSGAENMGALIRPRGCSKAEETHQNSPGGKDRGVTPGKTIPWLRCSQQDREPRGQP